MKQALILTLQSHHLIQRVGKEYAVTATADIWSAVAV